MKDKEQKASVVVNKSPKPVIVKTPTSIPITPIVKSSTSVVAKSSSTPTKLSSTSNISQKQNNSTIQKPNISNNNPINSLKSIKPKPINKVIADDLLPKTQMDITIKIYELPLEININPKGEKEFFVIANNCQVFVTLQPKQFTKLVEAKRTWKSWVGKISGKLGYFTSDGFVLEESSAQAFEHIPKVNTDTNTTDTSEKKKAGKPNKKESKLKKKAEKPNKPKTSNDIIVQEPFFDRIIEEQLGVTILIGRTVLKGTILGNQEYILIANINGDIIQIQKGAISLVSIRKSFKRNFANRNRTNFDNSENSISEITKNFNKSNDVI